MHAPVQAREVGEQTDQPEAAPAERIEHAHLDARMCIKGGKRRIKPGSVDVVEQQAHVHAALGRAQECLQQHAAGIVMAPDVVLRVDAVFGRVGEQDACRKCVATFVQGDKA